MPHAICKFTPLMAVAICVCSGCCSFSSVRIEGSKHDILKRDLPDSEHRAAIIPIETKAVFHGELRAAKLISGQTLTHVGYEDDWMLFSARGRKDLYYVRPTDIDVDRDRGTVRRAWERPTSSRTREFSEALVLLHYTCIDADSKYKVTADIYDNGRTWRAEQIAWLTLMAVPSFVLPVPIYYYMQQKIRVEIAETATGEMLSSREEWVVHTFTALSIYPAFAEHKHVRRNSVMAAALLAHEEISKLESRAHSP